MKKYLLLFLGLTIISCGESDDDSGENNEPTGTQNTLTIGNNSYNLQDGIIIDYGDWWGEDSCPENFNLDIKLYEDTVVTDATGRVISGSGKMIYLEMVSNGETLNNGNYSDVVNRINVLLNQNFSSFTELGDADLEEEEEESCFDANGYVFGRYIGNIVDGEEQYDSNDLAFSFLNGNLEFSRDSSNEITINLTGATMDESGLPITLNFRGFLSYQNENSNKGSFVIKHNKTK